MNKLYENEQAFAAANQKLTEELQRISAAHFPKDFVLGLYCECSNKACLEKISIALDEYAKAKGTPLIFIVKPDHYLPEFERVVERAANYCTVKKKPEKLSKDFEV
jgi:sugar/nucleoside kinase (ribokinase family)